MAILGARPQFIKHVMFEKACKDKLELITLHTGQHFDENMSDTFFNQLEITKPKYVLSHGGGMHGEQTGKMMVEIESIVMDEMPDAIVVYGDTNSTLAAALIASKMNIPLAHIEAGLRSYNNQMPEEINRKLTDHVSSWLFCPSEEAKLNLENEGISKGVYVVGDIMKDVLMNSKRSEQIVRPDFQNEYFYCTIHRPYNVSDRERLIYILDSLQMLNKQVFFAVHPRTKTAIKRFRIQENIYTNIKFIDPQPYFQNLGYIFYSDGLITDSGGMQKEAYWLNKKCITVRTETEWSETLINDANILMFDDLEKMQKMLDREEVGFTSNLYGDGNACNKIIEILDQEINNKP